MKPRPGTVGEGGFTLLECMVAAALLMFIVSQMALVSMNAYRTSTLARRSTIANMYAEEGIERSRNCAYNNLQDAIAALGEACVPDTSDGRIKVCTSTAVIDNAYTRKRVVTPRNGSDQVTDLTASNKAEVDLTVAWVDAHGISRQVMTSTVVSRY